MICQKCGKEHDGSFGSGKFCSRACANSRIRTDELKERVSKKLRKREKVVIKFCANCKKDLNGKTRYCSDECRNEWRSKLALTKRYRFKEPEFLAKLLAIRNSQNEQKAFDNLEAFGSRSSIRKYLIRFRGNKCQECGISSWNSKELSLEVHHIDGNCKNNKDDNLLLLCPNCHSQTKNWRRKKNTPV